MMLYEDHSRDMGWGCSELKGLARRRAPRLRALAWITAAASALVTLSACGSEPQRTPLGATTWQITNVYSNRDTPSDIPDATAGRAVMEFGIDSLSGDTGCAPFHARYTLNDNHMTLSKVHVVEPQCSGPERYYHDQIVELLNNPVVVTRQSEVELVLTADLPEADPPSMKLWARQ